VKLVTTVTILFLLYETLNTGHTYANLFQCNVVSVFLFTFWVRLKILSYTRPLNYNGSA